MIEIEGKQFSDEEILAEYRKRSDEYLEWRQQKAAEFLRNKERDKCYHCSVVSDADEDGFDTHMYLTDNTIARILALKEEISNDPELKTEEQRDDEFHDRLGEIELDVDDSDPLMAGAWLEDVDLDDYIYLYHFDIHLFDWNGNANGRLFPATVDLTDEEYIDLLAFLLDQPDCSFQHLAHLSPKLKAVYEKVSRYLDNYTFNVLEPFCHTHDYAIRMTELRRDAQTLIKQLEQKKVMYPYIDFLKDFVVNLSVCVSERRADNPATDGSTTTGTTVVSQQDRLAEFADLINQFARGDNFLAVELLTGELKRLINNEKLNVPCPILVNNDQIYISIPGIDPEKLSFERGRFAKTLLIFFLRQIERANRDKTVSKFLSQNEMKEGYSDELHKIYECLSRKKNSNLDSLFQKSTLSNDFQNTKSSINKCFDQYFNSDEISKFGKCYSIEKNGEEDSQGNPRYGVNLDVDDFDLGYYSIDRMKI